MIRKLNGLPFPVFEWTAFVAIATFAVFCVIESFELPVQLSLLSLPGRNALYPDRGPWLGGLAGPLLFALCVAVALSVPMRFRRLAVTAVLVTSFALALSQLWRSGASTGPVVGGFLPNSDARGYVFEGTRLLEGSDFTAWGSRRPLAGAYMGSMLWIADGNLRIALALLAGFTAVSFVLLLLRIGAQFGTACAGVAAFVLFMFYRRYLGSSLSENCGLTFGAVGLTLLLAAFEGRQMWLAGLGAICVSTGLNARAGAFFVLPCIVVAIIWHWRSQPRHAFRAGALAAICMVIATLANIGMFKALGAPEGRMFSNIGLTIYGTIHGGNWTLAYQQHPELSELPEGTQAGAVYKIIWNDLQKNPSLAFRGAWRAWSDFFTNRNGPYIFVGNRNFEWLLMTAAGIGLLFCCYNLRHRSDASILLSGGLGVSLSLPFAPPWDADSMRAYAVTIPFLALIGGAGVTAVIASTRRLFRALAPKDLSAVKQQASRASNTDVLVASFVLLSCVYLLPIAVRFVLPVADLSVLMRKQATADLTLSFSKGNILAIVPDETNPSGPHAVRRSDFLERLGYYGAMWHEQAAYLRTLAPYYPVFVIPGSTGMGFVVIRPESFKHDTRITLSGAIHAVSDGDFFVEYGLPPPPRIPQKSDHRP
jgi:hypothetical protein